MVKLVTYKASSEARQRAHKLIEEVRRHHLILNNYKFFCRAIGSQKRRCIVQDKNGKYDLDFQIVLTKKSKDGDINPTAIKKAFLQAFTDCRKCNEKVEDSATVVTVRCSKNNGNFDANQEKFSFDFVIISIDEEKRIRRNGPNHYTWVQLPSRNTYIYDRFRSLTVAQQRELLEECLLPQLIEEKKKDESWRRSTIDLFYTEVNNYYQRNGIK